jgi:hypothetical protein
MYFVVASVASNCVLISSSDLGTALVAGVAVLGLLLSARAFYAQLFLQPFVARQVPALAGDPPGHARARFRVPYLAVGRGFDDGIPTLDFELRGREQTSGTLHAQAVAIVR